jgi:hypothetical protein
MATTVALQPAASLKSEPKQLSAKREFEKIILEICRKFAASRALAGEQMELLIQRSEKNSISQRNWHLLGNAAEILIGPGAAALTGIAKYKGVENTPSITDAFQIGMKVGDVTKGVLGSTQYSQRMEQEKIQHANTQWTTFANGLQEAIRNLKTAQQRLQQMEDSTNR